MLWPYTLGGGPRRAGALLDAWLPPGSRKIEIPAPAADALAAVGALRLEELPAVALLLSLRRLPFRREMTIRQLFTTSPFVLLAEEPGRELVFGVAFPSGWRRRGDVPRSAAELRAALARGRAGAIGNFRAEPVSGGSRLWTETWVSTPALAASLGFTAYWLAIAPFSAWIRRMLLRGAARRCGACRA
jgi:hypothetical protein